MARLLRTASSGSYAALSTSTDSRVFEMPPTSRPSLTAARLLTFSSRFHLPRNKCSPSWFARLLPRRLGSLSRSLLSYKYNYFWFACLLPRLVGAPADTILGSCRIRFSPRCLYSFWFACPCLRLVGAPAETSRSSLNCDFRYRPPAGPPEGPRRALPGVARVAKTPFAHL